MIKVTCTKDIKNNEIYTKMDIRKYLNPKKSQVDFF